jgi:hypothetical protein
MLWHQQLAGAGAAAVGADAGAVVAGMVDVGTGADAVRVIAINKFKMGGMVLNSFLERRLLIQSASPYKVQTVGKRDHVE